MHPKPWIELHRLLGHVPLAAGSIDGETPLYAERYLYQDFQLACTGVDCLGLITGLGGSSAKEGGREMLPMQSRLVTPNQTSQWHYSGTLDFALIYLLDTDSGVGQRLLQLSQTLPADKLQFSDPLVTASAQELTNELMKGAQADQLYMGQLAQVMLKQCCRALDVTRGARLQPRHLHYPRIRAVLDYIRQHLGGDLSVTTLADQCGVSEAHFRNLFNEATGKTPHRYVLEARLEQARSLLTLTTTPVTRIAQECGFSSQSHLTSCFRNAYALTPASYRRQMLGASAAASA